MLKIIACFILVSFLFTANTSSATSYGKRYCKHPDYHCIKIKRGESWQSLWPSFRDRDLVKRLNRMNIALRPGMIIAVPNNMRYTDHFDIAPFSRYITPPGEKLLIFDHSELAWGAYDADGRLIQWGPASGGKNYCPDVGRSCRTAKGDFRMERKQGAYCRSSKYPLGRGGAPMPYCMFFFRGFAFHGSPEVPGYHASHGCVRLFDGDAKWLNQQFIELPNKKPNGNKGTRVLIQS
ncbi:MAG: L,D-transpeptidase [Gammaproteobacteria bacterium]